MVYMLGLDHPARSCISSHRHPALTLKNTDSREGNWLAPGAFFFFSPYHFPFSAPFAVTKFIAFHQWSFISKITGLRFFSHKWLTRTGMSAELFYVSISNLLSVLFCRWHCVSHWRRLLWLYFTTHVCRDHHLVFSSFTALQPSIFLFAMIYVEKVQSIRQMQVWHWIWIHFLF